MTGGKGDDTYIVDAAGDTVIEAAGGGIDTVESSVTFSLASRVNVENLELTGVGKINGTGNALANHHHRQRRRQHAHGRRRQRHHRRRQMALTASPAAPARTRSTTTW